MWSGNGSNPRLLVAPKNFPQINRYFDPSTPSMRNVEPPAKSKIAARGRQDGQRGLERGLILGFRALRPTITY